MTGKSVFLGDWYRSIFKSGLVVNSKRKSKQVEVLFSSQEKNDLRSRNHNHKTKQQAVEFKEASGILRSLVTAILRMQWIEMSIISQAQVSPFIIYVTWISTAVTFCVLVQVQMLYI